jgi:hypothetical protein
MSNDQDAVVTIVLIEDRWRVFINEEDTNSSFQFPWDAFQCAMNGALTGRPIKGVRSFQILCSNESDTAKVSRAKSNDAKMDELLATLRGRDGEGI